ncbi:MAG: hypothetical protein M1127_03250 [Patescibacteria group bacterium]|nr:hypothetical protein [Patescibacteria group bacterium]
MPKKNLFFIFVLAGPFLVWSCFTLAAWTNPTATPPNDNTPAPVNVGSAYQTKTGILQVKNPDANASDNADGNWFIISGYTKTYDQAKAACVAAGARLAYYSEIVDAFKNGASSCSYGWISEGFIVYPMQDGAGDGCGGPVGGVRVSYPSLSSLSGAYCARDSLAVNGSSINGGNLYAKGIYLNSGQSDNEMYLGLLANGDNADKAGICMAGVCKTAWNQVGGYWQDGGSGKIYYSAGNIGIGTASPTAPLNLASGPLQITGKGTPTGGAGVEIEGDSSFGEILSYNRGTSAYLPLLLRGSNIQLENSGTEAMRITGGNVGIGTTSPTSKLEVAGGQIEANGDLTVVGTSYLATVRSGGYFYSTVAATDKFGNANASGWGIDALNNGNWDLLVYDTGRLYSNEAYFGYGGSAAIRTYDTNENLAIMPNGTGNVGVGDASPSYKLDVAGQANATQLCIAGDCKAAWPTFSVSTSSFQVRVTGTCAAGSSIRVIAQDGTVSCETDDNTSAPGGSDTQIQYNNAGVLGGASQITYDDVNNRTTIGAPAAGNTLNISRLAGQSSIKSTDANGYLIMDSNGQAAGLNWYSADNVILANGGGNVGVGTASPGAYKLYVSGNQYNSGSLDLYSAGFRRSGGASYTYPDLYGAAGGLVIGGLAGGGGTIALNTTGGATPTMYLSGTGNVGVGDASPSYKLDVAGQANATQLCIAGDCKAAWPVSGSGTVGPGTVNKVSKFTAASAIGDSQIIDDGTNVGIGAAPERKLHVSGGNVLIDNARSLEAKNAAGVVETWMWPRYSDNVTYTNYGSAGWNIRNNSSVPTMFMTNGGSVGIGTTAPGGALHVVSPALAGVALFERSNQTTDNLWGAGQFLSTKTSSMNDGFGASVAFAIRDDAAVINTIASFGALRSGADNSGSLVFATANAGSNTEKMRITNTGYVGIGDASPSYKLDVAGQANATQLCIAGDCKAAWPVSGSGTVGPGTVNKVSKFTGANTVGDSQIVDDGISVGIGAVPERKLHVSGGNILIDNARSLEAKNAAGAIETWMWPRYSDNIMYTNYGSGGWNIRNSSSVSTMFMTNAGNVGIGTASPTAKLEVAGLAPGAGANIKTNDILLNSGATLFFDGNYSFAAGNYIRPIAANTQQFVTAGAERMRITSSGYVGIGTTAPTSLLHVEKALGAGYIAEFKNIQTGVGAKVLHLYNADYDANDYLLYAENGGGYQTVIDGLGRVGIGTSTPAAKLEVVGGAIKATGGLIMETRTTNPASPAVGQIWMCVDAGNDCQ